MIWLLIVANDLTGGLDTGVQFAGRGIPTHVVVDPAADPMAVGGGCAVLVVVAETRHLLTLLAYGMVYDVSIRPSPAKALRKRKLHVWRSEAVRGGS